MTQTGGEARCCVPGCPATEMDPRGLIEMAIRESPYREARPACTRHFELLVAIGLPTVAVES